MHGIEGTYEKLQVFVRSGFFMQPSLQIVYILGKCLEESASGGSTAMLGPVWKVVIKVENGFSIPIGGHHFCGIWNLGDSSSLYLHLFFNRNEWLLLGFVVGQCETLRLSWVGAGVCVCMRCLCIQSGSRFRLEVG